MDFELGLLYLFHACWKPSVNTIPYTEAKCDEELAANELVLFDE